ncbi:aminopeptidase M1-C-like [Lolium rigidum]|uniref:aminopeptidase M1-C-like n=1 Tax=Lolium rigidum TaxID=89674 RepID=UPI001F5C7D38|nr:aminopeptidase M1-C-like [Lolium rigidum]
MGFRCQDAHGENLKGSTFVPMLVSIPKTAILADSPDQFRHKLRLPRFAKPSYYELRFHPDLISYTFSGVVAITVDILQTTRFLVINVVDLTIDHASIHFKDLAPTEVVFFKDDQIMVLGFGKELPLGEGVLRMNFNGTLNDDLRGFYRSKYEYKGKTANMAVTQLQEVDARRCFPCWDEPAFKAKFKITLQVPSELVALSNMPVSSEIVDRAIKTVHFEESPLMSTYLVAMVVGIFDFVEGVTSQGTKVRVYTEVGKTEQGKFALDIGVKFLDLYNGYFGTPYALPKLDMIGIPDFSNMGMENYGLITFQVLDLLFDESSSTPAKQHEIANTVAHELAHQWFGNLVTMEWWTHAWLNEGFATWMSYHAVDYFFPQWNVWMEFLESTISTLRLDSLAGSHPIEVEIHHTSEIGGIFDDIIYIKGASIVGMLQSYLGAERFQKALASYIKKYAYSNANTEDLWAVLEAETGEPWKNLMSAWMKKPGYPVINVKQDGNEIQLEQAQFLLNGSSGSGLWDVPITLSCASSTKIFLLTEKYYKLDLCGKSEKEGSFSIKLNMNKTGFYHVKYDRELSAKLQNALEANMFSSMEKIGILENARMLSMARKDSLASLLYILYACRKEASYSVLTHIDDITSTIAQIFTDAMPKLVGDIKQLFIKVLIAPAEKLGWDPINGEADQDVSLRYILLVDLVKLGHDKTINEGVRRFNILTRDHNTSILSPDIRTVAYLSMMQTASSTNRSGYDDLRRFYRDSADREEKLRILGVLSYCSDKDIVLESLDLIFTNEVPNKDAIHLLEFISIDTREAAWSWLKENWDHILKVVPEKDLLWCIVNNIVPLFTSNDKAEEISKFFTNCTDPALQSALKRNLKMVNINMRWIEGIRTEPGLAQAVHALLHKT